MTTSDPSALAPTAQRAFIAAQLERGDGPAVQALRRSAQSWVEAGKGRFQAITERLLMLPFADLGTIPAPLQEVLGLILGQVAPLHRPLAVKIHTLYALTPADGPQLIYAQLSDRTQAAALALHRALSERLAHYGFALDPRPFAPLIPLGRVRQPVSLGPAPELELSLRLQQLAVVYRPAEGERGRWQRSHLSRLGAANALIYHEPLEHFELTRLSAGPPEGAPAEGAEPPPS